MFNDAGDTFISQVVENTQQYTMGKICIGAHHKCNASVVEPMKLTCPKLVFHIRKHRARFYGCTVGQRLTIAVLQLERHAECQDDAGENIQSELLRRRTEDFGER